MSNEPRQDDCQEIVYGISRCPETKRVFVVIRGKDGNVAEVFAHGRLSAYDNAMVIILALNRMMTVRNHNIRKRIQSAMNNEPLPGYDVWSSCDKYPREDWRYEVANNDTNLGYWDWVRSRIEAENGGDPNNHD